MFSISARVYRDLSPCPQYTAHAIFIFYFRFWSSSFDILLVVGAKIAWKWHVPSSLLKEFKKNGLKNLHFILPPASTRPMCLVCQETMAVMKISNLKRHHEIRHRNLYLSTPDIDYVVPEICSIHYGHVIFEQRPQPEA